MLDTARSSRRRRPHWPGLRSWLWLFLAPFAALFLLLSHAGSAWLVRGAVRPDRAMMLPGLTVEAMPNAPRSSRSRLVVTSIQSNGPATRGGIAVGDAVVAIDGARIFSLDQARNRLQKGQADTVALRVAHGHQLRDVRLIRARPVHGGERHGPQAAGHRG